MPLAKVVQPLRLSRLEDIDEVSNTHLLYFFALPPPPSRFSYRYLHHISLVLVFFRLVVLRISRQGSLSLAFPISTSPPPHTSPSPLLISHLQSTERLKAP